MANNEFDSSIDALLNDIHDETPNEIDIDYFDTNEELFPVIKNDTAKYDVICASDYMIAKLIENDLLGEINYFLTSREVQRLFTMSI